MIKLLKKVKFPNKENRMKSIANTKIAREMYYSSESKNVRFLLSKRFSWMNNFINENTSLTIDTDFKNKLLVMTIKGF